MLLACRGASGGQGGKTLCLTLCLLRGLGLEIVHLAGDGRLELVHLGGCLLDGLRDLELLVDLGGEACSGMLRVRARVRACSG